MGEGAGEDFEADQWIRTAQMFEDPPHDDEVPPPPGRRSRNTTTGRGGSADKINIEEGTSETVTDEEALRLLGGVGNDYEAENTRGGRQAQGQALDRHQGQENHRVDEVEGQHEMLPGGGPRRGDLHDSLQQRNQRNEHALPRPLSSKLKIRHEGSALHFQEKKSIGLRHAAVKFTEAFLHARRHLKMSLGGADQEAEQAQLFRAAVCARVDLLKSLEHVRAPLLVGAEMLATDAYTLLNFMQMKYLFVLNNQAVGGGDQLQGEHVHVREGADQVGRGAKASAQEHTEQLLGYCTMESLLKNYGSQIGWKKI
mmetsp:Transcript_27729/g.69943  ORF Transcript_27729/g.69943 Transcript_27729/m.69943 type:complete len:312 (-) Transcript_27729:309-1244(-)